MKLTTTDGRVFVAEGPWRVDPFDEGWPAKHTARDEYGQRLEVVKSPFGLAVNDAMAFEQPCWRLVRELRKSPSSQ